MKSLLACMCLILPLTAAEAASEWVPVSTLGGAEISALPVPNSREGDKAKGILRTVYPTRQGHGSQAYDRSETILTFDCRAERVRYGEARRYLDENLVYEDLKAAWPGDMPVSPSGALAGVLASACGLEPNVPEGWTLTSFSLAQIGMMRADPASRHEGIATGAMRTDLREAKVDSEGLKYNRMIADVQFDCEREVMSFLVLSTYLDDELVRRDTPLKKDAEPLALPLLDGSPGLTVLRQACS